MRVRGLEGTWGVLGGVAGRWGYVCVGGGGRCAEKYGRMGANFG